MKRMINLLSTAFVLGILLNGCSGDDNGNKPTGPEEPTEAKSGWMYGFRVPTPAGRVFYMSAHEEIPSTDDISSAVELGFNVRFFSYGENPYTWNSDAATITKWNVDKTNFELSTDGILSLASAGFSGAIGWPIFISETQAFYPNLREGLILEWNPSEMTITDIYDIDPYVSSNGNSDSELYAYAGNGKVFFPIHQSPPEVCCGYNAPEAGAVVGVFDINTKTIEYKKDKRLMAASGGFIVDESTGYNYVVPGRQNAIVEHYLDVDSDDLLPRNTLLRMDANGDFDPDFSIDLEASMPVEIFMGPWNGRVMDNKIIMDIIKQEDVVYPENFEDRWMAISGSETQSIVLDLDTKEALPFTALDKYSGLLYLTTVDGINYYTGFNPDGGSFALRQDGFDSYTEISTLPNASLRHLKKLW